MKTVAFHNLGCKVNSYEMEVMQQKFAESGYTIVPFDSVADIYVVNTCTVTNIADRKSRQMLHRAKKKNPSAVVIATGCYAQTDTESAAADGAVDIVIGNNRKSEIVGILEEYLSKNKIGSSNEESDTHRTKKIEVENLDKAVPYEDCGISYSNERTRVDIKIQDGCDQFCTYCMIPYARGRIRSRRLKSITEEVKRLADRGFKEVVLTGIHLSSYGIDLRDCPEGETHLFSYNALTSNGEYTNEQLVEVIDAVSRIDGIERVRLGSLEPRVITREFLQAISNNPKVCPHFHLSLQSGCDAVLRRMNRHYTTAEYYDKVCLLRKYYVNPAITTDIIVGFPGETEEEFDDTVEYVKKVQFYETHIFKFSPRRGTVAAGMTGQLTDAVKSARSDILEEIGYFNKRAFLDSHMGDACEILAEEFILENNIGYVAGHTPDYAMAYIRSRPSYKQGDLIAGKVYAVSDDGILFCERL